MDRSGIFTWLHWTPRVLGILLTWFVSLFALDVFAAGYSTAEALVAFVVHLLPFSGVLLLGLLLGWRWPWAGGVIYIGFGLFYILLTWGRDMLPAVLLLAGLPILTGLLFLLDEYFQRQQPLYPA